jgi:hypothetical protein
MLYLVARWPEAKADESSIGAETGRRRTKQKPQRRGEEIAVANDLDLAGDIDRRRHLVVVAAQASDVGVKAITAGRGKSHSLISDQTEIGHQVPAL